MNSYRITFADGSSELVSADSFHIDQGVLVFRARPAQQKPAPVRSYAAGAWAKVEIV